MLDYPPRAIPPAMQCYGIVVGTRTLVVPDLLLWELHVSRGVVSMLSARLAHSTPQHPPWGGNPRHAWYDGAWYDLKGEDVGSNNMNHGPQSPHPPLHPNGTAPPHRAVMGQGKARSEPLVPHPRTHQPGSRTCGFVLCSMKMAVPKTPVTVTRSRRAWPIVLVCTWQRLLADRHSLPFTAHRMDRDQSHTWLR